MKYFRFALISLCDNIKINLLMILEMIVVFVGVNLIIGSYNNRNMLYKPYSDILSNTGWYIVSDYDENTGEPLSSQMKGNLNFIKMYSYSSLITLNGRNVPVNITICPDEILNNMKLPVNSGKWQIDSPKDIVCIAAPNNFDISSGDELKLPLANSVKISGILTDPCYIPCFLQWSTSQGIENFYRKYSLKYYSPEEECLELFMSFSEFSETGIETDNTNKSFIAYDVNPTAENTTYNEELLKNNYQCGIRLSKIKERTENSINDILKKFIPIAVCTFVVIMIGFMSSTAINTLQQMKNYGTMFLCGMNWNDCIKILFAYNALIMISSVSITSIIFGIFKLMNLSAYLGLSFGMNNIVITAIIIFIIILLNLIILSAVVRRKTPVDIIRGNY